MFRRPARSAPDSFWRCGRCGTPNPWKSYLTNCLGCGAERPPRPHDPSSVAATATASATTTTTTRAKSQSTGTGTGAGQTDPVTAALRWAAAFWRSGNPARGTWLWRASWAYAAVVVIVLILIRTLGDRWWLPTALMFMPRWALLFPIVFLAAAAGWSRRVRLWALHAATLVVVAGPLMGLSLPVHRLWTARPAGPRVRILTLNQGNKGYNAFALIKLLEEQHVDVVCFQEGYTPPEGQPDEVLEAYFAKNWHRNKPLTIASRLPIIDETPPLDNPDGEESLWRARLSRVKLKTSSGAAFQVAAVHMPSMYYALERLSHGDVPSMQRHLAWRSEKMTLVASALADSPDVPMLVGGDFNMPSDSTLMSMLQMTGLKYAFDEAGWGYGYTRPSNTPWIRIDHVLASPEWTVTRCWVGPDVGSDHLPLLAEAVLPAVGIPGARASR